MRVEIVTECEHGYVEEHCADHPELAGAWHPEFWGYPPEGRCRRCSGGSRRVLEPGDAERIIARALAAHQPDELETVGDCVEAAVAILDALAEGEQ